MLISYLGKHRNMMITREEQKKSPLVDENNLTVHRQKNLSFCEIRLLVVCGSLGTNSPIGGHRGLGVPPR